MKLIRKTNKRRGTNRVSVYLCRCGNETEARDTDVKRGSVKSCGCIMGKKMIKEVDGVPSGEHPLYVTWQGIKARTNPNGKKVADKTYRDKGITICERWKLSFEDFVADMGPKPTPTHSIDRVDNDGNYEPSNCRWASLSEQNDNRSVSTMATYRGETKSIGRWEKDLGLKRTALRTRLNSGFTIEEAIECPKGVHLKTYRKSS